MDGVVDGEADADGEDEYGSRVEIVAVDGEESECHGEWQDVWQDGDDARPKRPEGDEEDGKYDDKCRE